MRTWYGVTYVPMRLSIPYHQIRPWWFGTSNWLGLKRKTMADYDETEPAGEPRDYIGLGGVVGGMGAGQIAKSASRESLRDRLSYKKKHLEGQIVLIDRTLSLLDSNPQMEEILNLLPKVGLY